MSFRQSKGSCKPRENLFLAVLGLDLAGRGTIRVGILAVSWFLTNVCFGNQPHKLFSRSGQGSMKTDHGIGRSMQRQSSIKDLSQIASSSHRNTRHVAGKLHIK
jgi:hypothetical protein